MTAINILFDGPPSAVAGRFVEVETDDGASINVGEWIERPDGLWALRITELPEDTDTIGTWASLLPEGLHRHLAYARRSHKEEA